MVDVLYNNLQFVLLFHLYQCQFYLHIHINIFELLYYNLSQYYYNKSEVVFHYSNI